MSAQAPEDSSGATSARVLALLAAWRAGQIDAPDMSRGAAVAMYAGKVLASRYADVLVSTLAQRPPLGITPGDQHLERLEEAVQTCLSDPKTAADRLDMLGAAEVVASEQKSLRAAIAGQGFGQWREDVAADACEVCLPFANRLHDADEAFEPHHPRCRCKPVPEGGPAPEPVPTAEPIRPRIRITRTIA
jgi:hypothetical protein